VEDVYGHGCWCFLVFFKERNAHIFATANNVIMYLLLQVRVHSAYIYKNITNIPLEEENNYTQGHKTVYFNI
jgi:hypothetical protein